MSRKNKTPDIKISDAAKELAYKVFAEMQKVLVESGSDDLTDKAGGRLIQTALTAASEEGRQLALEEAALLMDKTTGYTEMGDLIRAVANKPAGGE